MIPLPKLDAA